MNRIRRTAHLDRTTGNVTVTREVLPDAGFSERIQGMRDALPGHEPGDALIRVRCDSCGRTERLDCDNPVLPPGWTEGDYCPECQA